MSSDPTPRAGAEQQRILLVDDNATNLRVLHHALSGLEYKLLVAKDGPSAIDIATRTRPHLVLLDIMMPGMNGYEVCRRLKEGEATRDAAIVFLSALDDTENIVRGFELGAVDYISKPFQREEVVARVNTHLTLLRLRRELTEANERMRRDLDAAAQVQRSLLPASVLETPSVRFAWRYQPCDELAGDSLNVFWLGPRTIGAYVLDVSGHGVAPALLSVAVARSLLPRADPGAVVQSTDARGVVRAAPPAEVLRLLNERFPMSIGGDYFFTIVYGVLDVDTGLFTYASAGHPGPARVRAQGQATRHDAAGAPIGLLDDAVHGQSSLELSPGDRVYLYSDGLFEVWNADDELFEQERLLGCLARGGELALDESLDSVIESARAWSVDGKLTDDVAIVGLEFVGASG